MALFSSPIHWKSFGPEQQASLLQRPVYGINKDLRIKVTEIIADVQKRGDRAVLEKTALWDKVELSSLALSKEEMTTGIEAVPQKVRTALELAYENIVAFHRAQIPSPIRVATKPGILCEKDWRPIQRVGLYIPGGSAPLPSTVLMLGVPAQLAGCQKVVLCSPPQKDGSLSPAILYAAHLAGVETIFKAGGAQAIAAMAYGTESIPKVDKIFGPGNAWVTEAKLQCAQDAAGAALDMPAGPSEVLVLADGSCNPAFAAADLLSQAEHGPDSQVILVATSEDVANKVIEQVHQQLVRLDRRAIAEKALEHSRIILIDSLQDAVGVINQYGPEHLILQVTNAEELLPEIHNAGSIFIGPWTPESVGDYASGTNHVLPTYGWTKAYSSLGLEAFLKAMTIQTLTPQGLQSIGDAVVTLAETEGLEAHAEAVRLRLAELQRKYDD